MAECLDLVCGALGTHLCFCPKLKNGQHLVSGEGDSLVAAVVKSSQCAASVSPAVGTCTCELVLVQLQSHLNRAEFSLSPHLQ